MERMKMVISVLCAVGLASCGTLGLGQSNKTADSSDVTIQTEYKNIVETKYLPGRTVLQPYAAIPDKFPQNVPDLSDENLTGVSDDIGGKEAVGVGVNWAEQYHDLGNLYNGLYNWIEGQQDGQKTAQKALDSQTPGAPGVPENP